MSYKQIAWCHWKCSKCNLILKDFRPRSEVSKWNWQTINYLHLEFQKRLCLRLPIIISFEKCKALIVQFQRTLNTKKWLFYRHRKDFPWIKITLASRASSNRKQIKLEGTPPSWSMISIFLRIWQLSGTISPPTGVRNCSPLMIDSHIWLK